MLLKDYAIPRAAIPLPGKTLNGVKPSFDVRGLTVDDLTFLISQHLGPITRALASYQESRPDMLTSGNMTTFLLSVLRDFPDLVPEVISAAADALDDKTRAVAKQLPAATQIAALSEIIRLSVEDAGGLKNLLAEMRARIESAAASIKETSSLARPKTI